MLTWKHAIKAGLIGAGILTGVIASVIGWIIVAIFLFEVYPFLLIPLLFLTVWMFITVILKHESSR